MSGGAARPLALGVNIDHVATLRQARGVAYPDPVEAALVAEANGADSITVHLREDRRHIQEHDVHRLRERIATHLNLEMAVTPAMVEFCLRVAPRDCCLVPERRREVTTEGGLDVAGQRDAVRAACAALAAGGIRVALFVDPSPEQIAAAVEVGAPVVELHTGAYAEHGAEAELARLRAAARQALAAGLTVHAGHGLSVANVAPIATIPELVELNIGHSIVARAVFVGLGPAVAEMKQALAKARGA